MTAAIREQLAARGIRHEPPYGCSWCGDEQHHHGSQWAPIVGLHQWMEPSQAVILERMRRRRANGLDAELSGESADPYCADCKTDGCRQWMRIQTRVDNRRMELDGINPKRRSRTAGGWGDGEPW
ncbi:hypothetical protein [Streptomyces mirabilis]|uniref:hypothetical protein n=1 Tax=Streptomyces mirabilis TaxID=68239 RepID=UPI003685F37E